MSSATDREHLVKSIVDLTGVTTFEAIVVPDDGRLGCNMSHREIYKQIPMGEDLLIFEDDCEIIDPTFIHYITSNKSTHDIIYIGVNSILIK
jgi:hypothetical protein